MSQKVFEIVTSEILALLDQGVVPWKKTWKSCGKGILGEFPINAWGKRYRGMNIWVLWAVAQRNGYECNQWATYAQIKKWGGQVLEGEKSTSIIHCAPVYVEVEEEKDGVKNTVKKLSHWSTRYFNVFNIAQTDLYEQWKKDNLDPLKEEEVSFDPIEACESIVSGYVQCPPIGFGGNRAYYSPCDDRIQMPKKEDFESSEAYYATLFHELAHSTGAEGRLGRKGVTNFDFFGSHTYSQEELVAEICSAFLCGYTGISQATIENSASYIESWSRKLQENPKWFHFASMQAQKAFELILGEKLDDE